MYIRIFKKKRNTSRNIQNVCLVLKKLKKKKQILKCAVVSVFIGLRQKRPHCLLDNIYVIIIELKNIYPKIINTTYMYCILMCSPPLS